MRSADSFMRDLSHHSSQPSFPASNAEFQCSCLLELAYMPLLLELLRSTLKNFGRCQVADLHANAFCKPPHKSLAIRSTQGRLTFKADMICGSDKPSFLSTYHRTAFHILAGFVLPFESCRLVCWSSSFRFMCSFFGILDSPRLPWLQGLFHLNHLWLTTIHC